jgi:hypothetical protein
MADQATLVPAALVAGDTWVIPDTLSAATYPAPEWRITWVIRPLDGSAALTAEVADGAATFPASATAAVPAGTAEWVAVAEGVAGEALGARETLAAGRVTVKPDPLGGPATGTAAERILAAIDATLEGRMTKDAESYTIEGRSISRTPVGDLIRLQSLYARRVREERGESGIRYRRVKFC